MVSHIKALYTLVIIYCRPNWVQYEGNTYRLAMFVLAGWQEDDLPQFADIKDIMVINAVCFLHVQTYITTGIDRHVHSYVITKTDSEDLLTLS